MKKRGTSNTNVRGNTTDRERRKRWLFDSWRSDTPGYVRCYRCGCLLDWYTVTIDRIKPGAKGGRYVRGNIRPACAFDNSSTGQAAKAYPPCRRKVVEP